MKQQAESATIHNLRQLFSLVALIHANQGIEMERLASLAGFQSQKELQKALERLMMFGIPPFSPADYITVYIDENRRVMLDFPLGLERPLALTAAEWGALQRLLRQELQFIQSGDMVSDQLAKLISRLAPIPVEIENNDIVQSKRLLIQEALQDRLQLEFYYRTLSSQQPELRRVDPWALFQQRGSSYLIAFCHTRQAARFFHLERMQNIEILLLEQENAPPKNLRELIKNSPLFQENPSGFSIRIAFSPQLRSALELHLQLKDLGQWQEAGTAQKGWLTAKSKVQDSIWLRMLLRSLGPQIVLLSPRHLQESCLQELEQIRLPLPL